MNWFDLLSSLYTFLKADAGLSGVPVQLGGDAEVPEECTVQILRGPTQLPKQFDTVPGEQVLYVECWEYSEDHESPGTGYGRLAVLEQSVAQAIEAWLASDPFPGAELKAPLGAWQGDGDIFRPSVGSRMELTVKWRARPTDL